MKKYLILFTLLLLTSCKNIKDNDYLYLGNYVSNDNNSHIDLSLVEEDKSIHYYLSYYFNNSLKDELWGTWNLKSTNKLQNDNYDAIGVYNVKIVDFNKNTLVLEITLNELLNEEQKENVIPDGIYYFYK